MKMTKRILALILTLAFAFNMAIPAFAAPASSGAVVEPGKQVTLEFVYENVAAFEADMRFSDPSLVISIDDIIITDFNEVTWIEKHDDGDYYKILAFRMSDETVDVCTVSITLTVSDQAVVGTNLKVSLDYIVAKGDNQGEEGNDEGNVTVKPNTDELQALIAQANALVKDEYDDDKWQVLSDAVAEGYNALESLSQQVVTDAENALRSAINGLYDLNELNALIDKAQEKIDAGEEAKFSAVTWNAMTAALAEARTVSTTSKKQTVIDEAAAKLKAALDALIDTTELEAQIAAKEALDADEKLYTSESWSALEAAYTAAQAARNSTSQSEVEAAAANLKNALKARTEPNGTGLDLIKPYWDNLKTQLDAAEDKIQTGQGTGQGAYTNKTWNALIDEYNAAKTLYEAEWSRTEVVDATDRLASAINGLDTLDKSALHAQIIFAQNKDSDRYVDDGTFDVMLEVLGRAEAIYESNDVTQTEINNITKELKDALAALKLTSYVKLGSLLDTVKGLLEDGEDDYTTESWEAADLSNVHATAEGVYKDPNSDDADYEAEIEKLNEALDKLVYVSDYRIPLSNLINKVDADDTLSAENYSEATWKAFEEALKTAKDYIATNERSQTKLEAAKAALNEAYNAVKLNYRELIYQISIADKIIKNDANLKYTPDSWDAFYAEYEVAIAALENRNQDKINEAATNLELAIAALKEDVEYDALKELIDKYVEFKGDNNIYLSTEWNKTTNLYNKAYDYYHNHSATTQKEVETVRSDLETALKDLKPVNIGLLTEAKDSYDAVKNDTKTYTNESWDAATSEYNKVINMLGKKTVASLQTVEDAAKALNDAIDALDPISLDKLIAAIGEYDNVAKIDGIIYTSDTWSVVLSEHSDAVSLKTYLENSKPDSYSQDTIDSYAEDLDKAIDALVSIDLLDLETERTEYNDRTETDYTIETWVPYAAAAKDIADVLYLFEKEGQKHYDPDEIIRLTNAATDARKELVLIEDLLAELEKAINEAKKFLEADKIVDYTADSEIAYKKYVAEFEELYNKVYNREIRSGSFITSSTTELNTEVHNTNNGNSTKLVALEHLGRYDTIKQSVNDIWDLYGNYANWTDIQTAYDNATAARNARESSEKILEATIALEKAYAARVPADLQNLVGAIGTAEALTGTDYTAESWKAIADALKAAKDLRDNLDANRDNNQAFIDAYEALNAAYNSRVPADLPILIELVEQAIQLEGMTGVYTVESLNKLAAAREAAKEILDNSGAYQDNNDAIHKERVNLEDAISKLETPVYTNLKAAIQAAKALINAEKHTVESIAAFNAIIAEYEAFTSMSQQAIEAKAAELNEIVTKNETLKAPDYTALQDAIDKANKLDKSKYTATSEIVFNAYVDTFEAMINTEMSQEAINKAVAELNAEISNPTKLIKLVVSGFDTAEQRYNELKANSDAYENWAAIEAAYNVAVAAKNARVQEDLDKAVDALNAAIAARVPADLDSLKAAIDLAKKYEAMTDKFTAESIQTLAEARKAAEEIIDNIDKYIDKNTDIQAAVAGIEKAIEGLKGIEKPDDPINTVELIKQIGLAEILKPNANLYTAKSWADFETALNNANDVLENYKTQEEVDAATKALKDAMNALVKMDYTALKEQIGKVPADKTPYTEKSWAALEAVLKAANDALTSRDQAVVDKATADLKNAIDALVKMDYAALNEQIGKVPTDKTPYTEKEWAVLEAALKAAKEALTSRDQAVVDKATADLKNAIDALVKMDYAALNEQIGKVPADKTPYTVQSWAALEAALKAAKEALNSRDQTVVDKATEDLKNAIEALVKVGYIGLQMQIDRVPADETLYTEKSWAAVEEALKEAKEALKSRDQEVVNKATIKLMEAIDALVKMDYAGLNEQIDRIPADEKLYTVESWAAVEEALKAAKEALTSRDQAVVDKATADLKNAIDALVAIDYSKLEEHIAEAEKLNSSNYTAGSWAALEAALKAAKEALTSRDQAVVDAAAKALDDAITALEAIPGIVIDYSKLIEAIEKAEKLDGSKYTEESWKNLTEALKAAKEARNSGSQTVVDKAAKALEDAIKALAEKPIVPTVDYTELNKVIAEAEALKEADFTAETWKKLAEALKAAKEALNSNDQAVVNAAAKGLKDAIGALAEKPDYTELLAQIEAAEALKETDYTAETWKKLAEALTAGKAALESDDQTVVDAAAKAIKDAIAALETPVVEPEVDYTKLNEQIERAESLKEADYTAETWKKLTDALTAGKAALESKDQTVVDNAANALKTAIDQLEKATVEKTPDSPLGLIITIAVIVLAAAAAIVVYFIYRKKKKII